MRRLTWEKDGVPDNDAHKSVFYGHPDYYVEFERAYPYFFLESGRRKTVPVLWVMNKNDGRPGYIAFVAFCGPKHLMAQRAEKEMKLCLAVPKKHRLYKAFRAVLDGLPPEPFLDMLVEDFPRFEAVVSRFVEDRPCQT